MRTIYKYNKVKVLVLMLILTFLFCLKNDMAIKMVNIKKKYSFERMMNSDVINMVSKFGI